jgi:CheY-like chemotaxis protein
METKRARASSALILGAAENLLSNAAVPLSMRFAAPQGSPVDTSLTGRMVLIVEDHPLIALAIVTAFERAGAVTVTAHTLAEARNIVEQDGLSAAVLDFGLGDGDAEQLSPSPERTQSPIRAAQRLRPYHRGVPQGHQYPKTCQPRRAHPRRRQTAALREALMARQTARNEQRNRILDALSSSDFAILQPHLEPVPLAFRQRLQSANRQVKDVYFLESGLGSVVALATANGGGRKSRSLVARA